MHKQHENIIQKLDDTKDMSDDLAGQIDQAIQQFKASYKK